MNGPIVSPALDLHTAPRKKGEGFNQVVGMFSSDDCDIPLVDCMGTLAGG